MNPAEITAQTGPTASGAVEPGAAESGAIVSALGRRPWQTPELVHLPAGRTRASDAGVSEDGELLFELS